MGPYAGRTPDPIRALQLDLHRIAKAQQQTLRRDDAVIDDAQLLAVLERILGTATSIEFARPYLTEVVARIIAR